MPVPELMTWIPAQRRWTKMYRGHRYYISARQLGTAETKESSLAAANQFWRDKQAELDLAYRASLPAPRTPAPMEDVAGAIWGDPEMFSSPEKFHLAMFRFYTNILPQLNISNEDRWKLIPAHKYFTEYIQGRAEPMTPEQIEAYRTETVSGFLQTAVEAGVIPQSISELLTPARQAEIETGVKALRGESTAPAERTVQSQLDAWLAKQRTLVSIKAITPAYCYNAHNCLKHFVAFLGESADIRAIDRDRLDGFHNFCLSKIAERLQDERAGWSTSYAREVFATARAWIRWLDENCKGFEAPKNLNSRSFRFGSTLKEIETWSPEEVRHVIGKATGRLKLALLLMCNCGMTQKDVSDLQDTEVNWTKGRIRRKRSKTKGQANVPTVEYPLWASTFALLKKYRSGTPRVLITKSGVPFVNKGHVNGQLTGGDSLAENFKYLKKKIGFRKSMKLLRKTGASLLESHETYESVTSLFLGHSPRAMKHKHYTTPPQKRLDDAVRWLGDQLGIADLEV